ncbi:MAG: hypothetical protein M3245_03420 [Actinomycetota bacterium]|nr:hypothetical protein [Actinomycetota bacterium]
MNAPAAAASTDALPLTERILSRLPGPRLPWMVAWALVPWLNAAVVLAFRRSGVIRPAPDPVVELLNRAAFSLAVLLSLWGAARIAEGIGSLRPALSRVIEPDPGGGDRLFEGMGSTVGPLALTAVAGAVLPLEEALGGDPVAAAIEAVTWAVLGIPVWTAFWVYVKLQAGLIRLGRRTLTLEPYPGDRSLGLRPVGRLAFTGFWMLFGAGGPLVLTAYTDLPGVVAGTAVLVAGVVMFFLSLRRLHEQMVAAKERELVTARHLYRQAYQPLRDRPTLEALQRQAGVLSAAEALEKRAERIQEWPFDEATFARVVTIASSVSAIIIGRLILDPVGL